MKKMLSVVFLSVGLLSACQSDSSEAGTEVELKKEEKQEIMKEVKQEYEFKDIEKMDKEKSFEEAFDNYFGHDRHFTAYAYGDEKEEIIFGGPIKELDMNETSSYYDREVQIYIQMKIGVDTRVEMIDFLHYLKYSGLLEVEEPIENDSNGDAFPIRMLVYPPTKPGMNTPEAYQEWTINNKKVEAMDFSDKLDILRFISQYGEFEGVNPTVQ
ncbi:hypothetical protein [Peribacillus frigoritolerans]|uniref:hypothetical protein n=1 Tax=Peribacillus frigoritolerans TaxID=450367 RepID=UPI0007BEE5A8|nr:hypothetical protein [Peribacillus frigoritolerans]